VLGLHGLRLTARSARREDVDAEVVPDPLDLPAEPLADEPVDADARDGRGKNQH
jgi:hypothetical protein